MCRTTLFFLCQLSKNCSHDKLTPFDDPARRVATFQRTWKTRPEINNSMEEFFYKTKMKDKKRAWFVSRNDPDDEYKYSESKVLKE